jgi:methanogenic corrinoid protein MtbC1
MAKNKDRADGEPAALSIGALASATGIPVETIRTWERRYGVPVAERKLSGHRVYPLSTVSRLRRIAEAIARGHRAAEVVPASENALDALLASLPAHPSSSLSSKPSRPRPGVQTSDDLVDAARRFDAESLKRSFEIEWARLSAVDFLEYRAAPFLREIGIRWAQGSLDVRHEHFASAVLGDFLRTLRMPLEERARGPVAVLTTLPGELHGLGLQMSSLVFAISGWRTLVLGVDTPVDDIAAISKEIEPGAIGISCIQPLRRKSIDQIAELRRRIQRRTSVLIGGEGAGEAEIKGVETIPSLRSLEDWLSARQSSRT